MTKDKIKFQTQIKPEFINELRDKIKEYFETKHISKYGNANMVIKSIFMVSLYLAPYILMLSGTIYSLSGIILCWVTMGLGLAGVGMSLMHDANHGAYSRNRKINKLLGQSLYLLGAFPATWQYQHNTLHHGFTNIDGHDEDIDPMGILRFSPHKPLLKIHKFQYLYAWFLYGLMTLSWTIDHDFKKFHKYKKKSVVLNSKKPYNHLLFKLILSKILYFCVFLFIPLIFLPIPWHWVVLSFLIMHYTSGLILTAIFQAAHVVPTSNYPLPDESGNIENNWAIHQLMTTSDFSPKSRIFSWLIGGLNYQVVHHLFPNICHVHYKNMSSIVKETAQKYNLPYYIHTSFFRAIRNHSRMLKILGSAS